MFAALMKKFLGGWLTVMVMICWANTLPSCANMVPPTGGPRDSVGPQLLRSVPENEQRNFKTNRITLQFDEYVQIENAYENVIVSPTQNTPPIINSRLRTVTINIKDTLEPNTTYSIQFGNAIKDVNEGNPLKDFSYVFSTGNRIDSFTLSGKVSIAQTGKLDTTLIVLLHRNLDDSAVAKERPRYYTRLDGKGNFTFQYLPAGTFRIYALKDEGFRRYTDGKTVFAFADQPVTIGPDNAPVNLYAFVNDPGDAATSNRPATGSQQAQRDAGKSKDKDLKYQASLQAGEQDLLGPLQITFPRALAKFDSNRIVLTDTNYRPVSGYTIQMDTSRQKMTLQYPWKEEQFFRLLIPKDAVADSAGLTLARNDSIRIRTRPESSYGSLLVRFNGVDLSKNPLLQWISGENVVRTDALTSNTLNVRLFAPGNYDLRILYDTNKNGIWDTGDFYQHRQPELAEAVDKKFNIRANWDNEYDVSL